MFYNPYQGEPASLQKAKNVGFSEKRCCLRLTSFLKSEFERIRENLLTLKGFLD
jgi:hypothetical protein